MTQTRHGVLFGVGAYAIWGLFPLYWPLLEPAGALEILAHRIVWSLLVVGLLIVLTRSRRSLRTLVTDRRAAGLLALAGFLIAGNWGIYIFGVNSGHVVETSLGYYVNPLFTVLLAVLVLGERLRRTQWAALALGAAGVAVLTVAHGQPPWIALALAGTFGSYGLVKRVVSARAMESLTIETAVLAPMAVAYLVWPSTLGTFTGHGAGHAVLLAGAGVVTAVPLLFFAAAASRVSLSTLGLLQYLTPTLQLIIGLVVDHEAMPPMRLAGFAVVWLALVVFSADGLRARRMAGQPPASEVGRDVEVVSVGA